MGLCSVALSFVLSVEFGRVLISYVRAVKLCSGGVGSVELSRLTSVPFCLVRLRRLWSVESGSVHFGWVKSD